MTTPAVTIEIRIDDLSLETRGRPEDEFDDDDVNIIAFSMLWPAEGISNVEQNKVIKARADLPQGSFYDQDYYASIICKTLLRGEAVLKVDVAYVDRLKQRAKGSRTFGKRLLTALLGAATGGMSNVIVSAATGAIGNSLIDRLRAADADPVIFASGSVPLDSGNLPENLLQCDLYSSDENDQLVGEVKLRVTKIA